jgi:hypothetical protein
MIEILNPTIDDVIHVCGGPQAIAEKINRRPNAIAFWRKKGIPGRHWLDLIELSSGQVTADSILAANKELKLLK